jgi:hypothetical protein
VRRGILLVSGSLSWFSCLPSETDVFFRRLGQGPWAEPTGQEWLSPRGVLRGRAEMSDRDQMLLRCDLVEIRKNFELEGLGPLQTATFRCPATF